MSELFNHQLASLQKLNIQRNIWLVLSVALLVFIGIVLFTWDALAHLLDTNGLRVAGIVVISVTASWWYWTMRLITNLISYRTTEIQILKEITEEISELKELFKQ